MLSGRWVLHALCGRAGQGWEGSKVRSDLSVEGSSQFQSFVFGTEHELISHCSLFAQEHRLPMASPPRPWDNVFTMEGLPARVPVLAIRNRVLFQGGFLRLTIGRPRSLKLAEMIWDGKTGVTPDARGVAIFSTRPADAPEGAGGATDTGGGGVGAEVLRPATPAEKKAAAGRRASGAAGGEGGAASPGSATGGGESGAATMAELGTYGVGTLARIVQLTKMKGDKGYYTMLVEGVCRIRLESLAARAPFFIAHVSSLPDLPVSPEDETRLQATSHSLERTARELIRYRFSVCVCVWVCVCGCLCGVRSSFHQCCVVHHRCTLTRIVVLLCYCCCCCCCCCCAHPSMCVIAFSSSPASPRALRGAEATARRRR